MVFWCNSSAAAVPDASVSGAELAGRAGSPEATHFFFISALACRLHKGTIFRIKRFADLHVKTPFGH